MAREPASIRYKNPGAMWPGPIATRWHSKSFVSLNDGTGQGNKIAVFDNWVDGICAQLDLWRTSPRYRNKRFADAIAVWSGHNNVPSYIAYVKARVPGITENTVMNDAFWRGPMAVPFLKAQSGHEAGKTIPAPDADWLEAQHRVMSGVPVATPVAAKPAAHATTATAGAGTAAVIIAGVHQGWAASTWMLIILGTVMLIGGGYAFYRWRKASHTAATRPVDVPAAQPVQAVAKTVKKRTTKRKVVKPKAAVKRKAAPKKKAA